MELTAVAAATRYSQIAAAFTASKFLNRAMHPTRWLQRIGLILVRLSRCVTSDWLRLMRALLTLQSADSRTSATLVNSDHARSICQTDAFSDLGGTPVCLARRTGSA